MAEESETSSLGVVVSYEELAAIEDEFEEIDTEIMRHTYALGAGAYAKRAAAVSKIPNFWPLVFEQVPLDIDQYIQPQDSRILAESFVGFSVSRPELDDPSAAASGNPRSLKFRFEFKPNDDFEDEVLEKTFWYRRAKDGWAGLVSEPVRIKWKQGKDLTEGLTDLSAALFEARAKTGDPTSRGVPEYATLKKKVESWNGMNTSFFTWFGWVSGRRWVSKEEDEAATAEFEEVRARRKRGEKAELPEPTEEEIDEQDDSAVEVHQAGEEMAISLADEVWPSAIKLFTQAQEADELSDADFEDDDLEDEEGGADEEDGVEAVDIRALVQEKGGKTRTKNGGGPASKKQKT